MSYSYRNIEELQNLYAEIKLLSHRLSIPFDHAAQLILVHIAMKQLPYPKTES